MILILYPISMSMIFCSSARFIGSSILLQKIHMHIRTKVEQKKKLNDAPTSIHANGPESVVIAQPINNCRYNIIKVAFKSQMASRHRRPILSTRKDETPTDQYNGL